MDAYDKFKKPHIGHSAQKDIIEQLKLIIDKLSAMEERLKKLEEERTIKGNTDE